MWNNIIEGKNLIREITLATISEVAPDEIDVFEELLEAYFHNPKQFLKQKTMSDNPLGSGLEDSITIVTPAIAAMAGTAISYLIAEVIKVTQEEALGVIRKKLQSLFDKKRKEKAEALTPEQLLLLKKKAFDQAILFGASEQEAEQWANALVGVMSMYRPKNNK